MPAPMPEDTEGWARLRDKLPRRWPIVSWLAASTSSSDGGGGGLDARWLATQFLLEPWNEFDAKAGADCDWPSAAATARAAELQAAVAAALASTGAFSGSSGSSQLPTPASRNWRPSVSGVHGSSTDYIAAYYARGGGGLPSVHWYGCDVKGLEKAVGALEAVPPAAHRGHRATGGTGCALATMGGGGGGGGGGGAFWRAMDLADGGTPRSAARGLTSRRSDNYGLSVYTAAGSDFFRVVGAVASATTRRVRLLVGNIKYLNSVELKGARG